MGCPMGLGGHVWLRGHKWVVEEATNYFEQSMALEERKERETNIKPSP